MPVHVRLSQFEGPLEMLLSLIEDRKLDVSRLSLSEVTDQYLARLSAERERIGLENLASFLLIASRLILLKSKTLLPVLGFTEEEEEEIEDLEARLREYKRFKEVAERLGVSIASGRRSFSRLKLLGAPEVYVPPKGLSAEVLHAQFENVLGTIPTSEELVEEAIEEVVSLEERILTLRESLRGRAEAGFRELLATAEDRTEVIVSFLAVLEMVKLRLVSVRQEEGFGEIRITVVEAGYAVS